MAMRTTRRTHCFPLEKSQKKRKAKETGVDDTPAVVTAGRNLFPANQLRRILRQEAKGKENDGKPSNSNDQSLYLDPRIPSSAVASELRHGQANDQAWCLVLGSLWLARKPNSPNVPPPTDYSVLARRLRRFRFPNQK